MRVVVENVQHTVAVESIVSVEWTLRRQEPACQVGRAYYMFSDMITLIVTVFL